MDEEDSEFQERRIILIGYRCTGKTTVGKRLAERLNLPFYDTDGFVEESAGKTIREMVAAGGWEFFRHQEQEAIRHLTARGKGVIATGGGAVLDPGNAALLKKTGIMVWLMADAETIRERMQADPVTAEQRPRFSAEDLAVEIGATLAVRTPLYRSLADLVIDTTVLDIEACVDRIVEYVYDID